MSVLDRRDLQTIVTPTVGQILISLLVAVGLLVGPNAYVLFIHYQSSPVGQQLQMWTQTAIHHLTRESAIGYLTLILFWVMVACLVYALYWIIVNVLITTYNELTIDTTYVNGGTALEKLSPPLLQFFFGLTFIGLLLISSLLFSKILYDFSSSLIIQSWHNFAVQIGYVAAVAVDIYILWVIGRITFYIE